MGDTVRKLTRSQKRGRRLKGLRGLKFISDLANGDPYVNLALAVLLLAKRNGTTLWLDYKKTHDMTKECLVALEIAAWVGEWMGIDLHGKRRVISG